jgi:hypothetical protein
MVRYVSRKGSPLTGPRHHERHLPDSSSENQHPGGLIGKFQICFARLKVARQLGIWFHRTFGAVVGFI